MRYLAFLVVSLSLFGQSFNPSMQAYIEGLKNEVKKIDKNFSDFSAKRGEKIFTSKHIGKRDKEISCTSCHGLDLRKSGKNIHTNKILKPLAPSVNKERLTSVKDVKKWLRRNFRDVYNRVGTAKEKGDVLYYINSK